MSMNSTVLANWQKSEPFSVQLFQIECHLLSFWTHGHGSQIKTLNVDQAVSLQVSYALCLLYNFSRGIETFPLRPTNTTWLQEESF